MGIVNGMMGAAAGRNCDRKERTVAGRSCGRIERTVAS